MNAPILFELESTVTRWNSSGPSKWDLIVQLAGHLNVDPASLGVDDDGRVVDTEHRLRGVIRQRGRCGDRP